MTQTTIGGPRIVINNAFLSAGVKLNEAFIQLRDATLGEPCEFSNAADGSPRCLPFLASAFYFSDDQCKTPLGVVSDDCVASKYIAQLDSTTCTTKMFQAGTKLDLSTPHYIKTPGGCVQVAGSNTVALYTLGPEVPIATFAAGTRVKK